MIAIADRARAIVLRRIAKSSVRSFVVDRTRRIGARAAIAIVFALVLASTFPALALAVGPIVFGIPHVAASLRYLVVRRDVSRLLLAAIVLASSVIVLSRVAIGANANGHAAFLGAATCARIEIVAGASLFAVACASAARRSKRFARGAVGLAILAIGLAVAVQAPFATRLAFVHVHNLGVVVLWFLLFRRGGALPKLAFAALAAALVLTVSGVTIPLARSLGGLEGAGVDCADVARWLAPSGVLAAFALPLVVMHAFTDSVHYAFWLGVVPEEALPGEGTLTFRMTARGLVRDFGAVGLTVVVGTALAIVALGVVRGGMGRDAYFIVAGFHGYVEGAMLVYLLVHGRSGAPARARSGSAILAVDRDRVARPRANALPALEDS